MQHIPKAAMTRVKADVKGEFDGKELQGFAAAFGFSGKAVNGDPDISNDWSLVVAEKEATTAISLMKKAGYRVDDRRESDGYITVTGTRAVATFSFGNKKGACVFTALGA